jgi:hypothetical protein
MMPKKPLQPKSFAWLAVIFFSTLIFDGCKKQDFQNILEAKQSFKVADAKEWWFGTFRKSNRFKSFDPKSNFILMKQGRLNGLTGNLTPESRFPSWKTGTVHEAGSTTFIQLTLVQAYTSIPIPVKSGENEIDRKRIANATLQKILIIKLPDGRITERIVTIIPSLDFLKKHHYLEIPDHVDPSFWIMLTHHSGMLTHHVFWKSEIHDLGTMLSISGC